MSTYTLNSNNNTFKSLSTSYLITFLILFTTLIFIFMKTIKSDDKYISNLFSLEICVLLISSYFYWTFINETNLSKIAFNRYLDWSLTTPILLLTLLLIIHHENRKSLNISYYLFILFLNYLMIYLGYLGETNVLNKNISILGGFIFYIMMILVIYFYSVTKKSKYIIKLLFYIFSIVWALYGFSQFFDENIKNHLINNLDIISKCLSSMFIWIYYGNVFSY